MDTLQNHNQLPLTALEAVDEYDFLQSYDDYDNPNLIADLRVDLITKTRGKNKREARKIRSTLINRYIDRHLQTSGFEEDEIDEARDIARADVVYWTNISLDEWNGDVDHDGNFVGNGLYHELAGDIRDWQLHGDVDTETEVARNQALETYQDAKQLLDDARKNLAELQTGFRFKFGFNGLNRRRELHEAQESYRAALLEANKLGLNVVRSEAPEITDAELKQIALMAYAEEFHALLEEQKKPEYVNNRYGKMVRKLGSLGLPAKLALTAAAAGVSVAALTFGGVLTGVSAIGLLGYRTGKAIIGGARGHNTSSGTDRILSKVTQNIDQDARQQLEAQSGEFSDEQLAVLIGGQVMRSVERIDRSDRNRRVTSAAITIAAIIPGVIGVINKFDEANDLKEVTKGAKDAAKDKVIERQTQIEKPTIPAQPETPVAPTIPEAPVDQIPVAPTNPLLEIQNHLMSSTGEYPWDRAVEAFNGDEAYATQWIKDAAEKAGATWYNEGTRNAWIMIDGRSDTDYVWAKLVEAATES